ncbi:MAG: hypothetical protein NTAFB05_23950 [Nitrobacter sp.]
MEHHKAVGLLGLPNCCLDHLPQFGFERALDSELPSNAFHHPAKTTQVSVEFSKRFVECRGLEGLGMLRPSVVYDSCRGLNTQSQLWGDIENAGASSDYAGFIGSGSPDHVDTPLKLKGRKRRRNCCLRSNEGAVRDHLTRHHGIEMLRHSEPYCSDTGLIRQCG